MAAKRDKNDMNTRLSMKLSGILRHGHDGFKRHIDSNGWLEIETLLRKSHFCLENRVTHNQIVGAVESNEKKRYKISEDGRWIKANQGHTIAIEDSSLRKLTLEQAASYSAVVHGSYYNVLNLVMKHGLSKMKRNHIHLTASDRVDSSIGVISGFRGSCEILVYIDMCNAIEDGLEFFVSENNVILCAGNSDGYLESKYFLKVIDRNTHKIISRNDEQLKDEQKNVETSELTEEQREKIEKSKNIRKEIAKLRKKQKVIDDIERDLENGKKKKCDLEKEQLENISKKEELYKEIEKYVSELRALNPKSNEDGEASNTSDISDIMNTSDESAFDQTEVKPNQSKDEKVVFLTKEIKKLQKKLKSIAKILNDLNSGKIKENDLEKEQKEKISKKEEIEEQMEELTEQLKSLHSN